MSSLERNRLRIGGLQLLYSRILMAAHLGRPLNKDEVVHHIDRNILNDVVENLQIMSPSEHARLHHLGARYKVKIRVHKPKEPKGPKQLSETAKKKIYQSKRREAKLQVCVGWPQIGEIAKCILKI